MAKQTVLAKKRRGPAPTGKGTQVVVRMQPPQLSRLDHWIDVQPEPKPSRPEAARQLIDKGLTVPAARKPKRGAPSQATHDSHAKRAAHDYIDDALKHEPAHVRTERKKRLTTMPSGTKRR